MRTGERLKEIRIKKDWTRSQLSRETGIGRTTIAMIEDHSKDTKFHHVVKICEALDYDLYELAADVDI